MRIVGGTARGRRIEAPADAAARPTGDRVREAVFNMLFSLGDVVAGATVLDAFAGTGALGLEALSRGALHATFLERDRRLVELIRRNVATLGFSDRATLVTADATKVLAEHPVELAFLDPPYAFDGWAALWPALSAAVAVVESDRAVEAPATAWELARERRYGTTVVRVFTARPTASQGAFR